MTTYVVTSNFTHGRRLAFAVERRDRNATDIVAYCETRVDAENVRDGLDLLEAAGKRREYVGVGR